MTEQEWLTGEDPAAMLRVVTPHISSTGHASPFGSTGLRPISDRKLRLFAAACAWNVADAARFCSNVDQFIRNTESWAETGQAPPGVRESSDPVDIHDRAIDHATRAANWALLHRGGRTLQELMAAQAALLRDIVGNPFRPVSIGQDWRPGMPAFVRHGWVQGQPLLTPTVLSLAHAAYDERPRRCGCGRQSRSSRPCANSPATRSSRPPSSPTTSAAFSPRRLYQKMRLCHDQS